MSAVDLQYPIFDSGIRTINFFNGRLLTALDLTREQAATHEADIRLGQAIGEGIAFGLEVTKSPEGTAEAPIVTVQSGLAVNRNGQVLRLVGDPEKGTDVALVRQASDSAAASKAFTDCLPLQSGTYIAGPGVYLLTLAPAQSNEGKAPTNGLTGDSGSSCNKDATVTTVQFRLLNLVIDDLPADQNLLRNHIASRCFGLAGIDAFAINPFVSQPLKYGLLDDLRKTLLTNCDVPLAVLYWTVSDGIKFIDNWSVRRRLRHPSNAGRLSPYLDERRASEGEAMVLQFEDQLVDLVVQPNPENLVATSAFKLLPPAGIVPLRSGAQPAGFTYEKFFRDKNFALPTPISSAKLDALFAASLHYPPIDLSRSEFVQLYTVVENSQAQSGVNPPQPYVVFASQEMPYYSERPRFAELCQTLKDARDAYRNLIARSIFFPPEVASASMRARVALQTAIQQVVQFAGERHVAICKCGCAIKFEKALDLLYDVYLVQRELVGTFLFAWPGLTDTALSQSFANQLQNFLDVATPAGKPSLNQAITAADLKAAIAAQDVINRMVLGFTGGGAATTSGTFQVIFQPGLEGTQLVLRSVVPVNYVFSVRNLTNREASVDVTAAFLAPHTDWNVFIVGVFDLSGNRITPFTLQPVTSNPADPATFKAVRVSVLTPTSATSSDHATLKVTATSTAIGRANFDQVDLTFGEAPIVGKPTAVRFSSGSPFPTRPLNQGKVNITTELRYDVTFHSNEEPATRLFVFHVIVTTTATRRFYDIAFDKPVNDGSTATTSMDIFTQPFSLTSDSAPVSVTVGITPFQTDSGALPGPLTFTARLQSVDDSTVSDERSLTITVIP